MATSTEELQATIAIDIEKNTQKAVPNKILIEEIQTKIEELDTDAEKNTLKKIVITKEIFEQIKKGLADTVKSMEKNPSLFSRAAEFWGTLPLWQKILGGIVLTVPTLIIGIVMHIGFLLAICGVTAITYAAGSIILDDHHKCSSSVVESLKKGILGLADLLELTINALDAIREQLEVEVKKLAEENEKLNQNINTLSSQIDALDTQVRATFKITDALGVTRDGMKQIADTLQEQVTQHTNLLEQNQQKLTRITEAYNTNQLELSSKILEVAHIKSELDTEVKRAKTIVDALQASIAELSNIAIEDEEQRLAFKQKLDTFLSNKEASFHQIAERICEAERKLALVQKELEGANTRYQELLKIQGQHIDRLAELGTKKLESNKTTPIGDTLNKNGFYAVKASPSITEEPTFPKSAQFN